MKTLPATLILAALLMNPLHASEEHLIESLHPFAHAAAAGSGEISAERKAVLDEAAAFISRQLREQKAARLTFICTHNSRRSHFAQITAQAAALYYGLRGVETFSGGTAATACNPRTIAALQRAGFNIEKSTSDDNPVYLVTYAPGTPPLRAFSKVYHQDGNPTENYAAFLCCDTADEACPVVLGAVERYSINYTDPKKSDGTPGEAATYDERCRQIACEMFYLMSLVKI